MDFELEDALELADQKQQLYLKNKKEKSRQSRLHYQDFESTSPQPTSSGLLSLYDNNHPPVFLSSIDTDADIDTPDDDADISDVESDVIYYDIDEGAQSIDNIDSYNETSIPDLSLQLDTTTEKDSFDSDQFLHAHTDTRTDTFCYRLLRLFREAGLSKTERRKFLDLIHTALPIPNNLPSNINKLLSMLEIKHNLFRKRKICIFCYHNLPEDTSFCPECPTSSEKDIAFIYDSDIKFILSSLIKTLWKEIHSYKQQIQKSNDVTGTKDIGFGYAYQHLLNRFPNEFFVTALMHLDGIGLCKSSRLKLWLFSFSIVELPAKIRYQKYNMPVVSIWISSKEPVASVWLQNSVAALEDLKASGIVDFKFQKGCCIILGRRSKAFRSVI